ncbi:MAG TPA: hypothetical protein VK045_02535 [Ornithinicoccus sp.]|nr:hypothetical protein [Ornithinicoccus sp.]
MSTIPAVLDTLVARWTATPPAGLRPDQVFDGPPAGGYVGTEGLAVGASIDDDDVVAFTRAISDLRGGPREQYPVTCLIWCGSGDTATKPRRDRVAAILDALEQTLLDDPTLGGAVSRAWLTGGAFQQRQTGRGVLVTATFQVDITRL